MKDKYIRYSLFSFCCLLFIFSPWWGQKGTAQDIHFSQFFNAPLLHNPASAGSFTGDFRFGGIYRNQWKSVTIPYKTYSFFADKKMKKEIISDDFSGAGVSFYSDQSGTAELSTIAATAFLAYHKKLGISGNHEAGIGISGSYVQKSVNYSNLTFHNQYSGVAYNPEITSGESFLSESFQYPDFAVGINWKSLINQKMTGGAGFAWLHLTKPKESFYRSPGDNLDPRLLLTGDLAYSMNEKTTINGLFLYEAQAKGQEFNITLFAERELKKSALSTVSAFGGLQGRFTGFDAIMFYGGMEYNNWRGALSYDFNTSTLTAASNGRGAVEFSLIYIFNLQQKIGIQKTIPCKRL